MLGRFRKKQTEHLVRESSLEDIRDHYNVEDKEIGSGSFSVVRKGVNKKTGEVMAVKTIDKKNVKDKTQMLQMEVDILKRVSHRNIIHLREVYEDAKYIHLVMELVTGGELFDRIVTRGCYSERDASLLMRQVLQAVAYLHDCQIVHRDLKPENLLMSNPNVDADVKMADFGLSKIVDFDVALHTACGTPGYVAPEVLKQGAGGYGYAVDVWACGVIMYILLCGFPPFYADSTHDLFEMIMAGRYEFPSPYWDNISESAKDLISRMLVVDPTLRYTATECIAHPWIGGDAAPEANIDGIVDRINTFNARRRFKTAGLAVYAVAFFSQGAKKST